MYLVPNSRISIGDASQFPRRSLRPGRTRRRRLLGQGGGSDPVSQAIAPYVGKPFYSHMQQFVASDLSAGVVDSGGNYATGAGVCAGQAPNVSGGQIAAAVGGSIAPSILKIAAPALAAGPVGAIVAIGAAVIGLFASLFHPHAYTRQETAILCQAVPTANAVLRQIAQELQYGTITLQQAIQAYNTLLSQFANAVGPIINHSAGNYAQTGDNAEFVSASLKAIVLSQIAALNEAAAPGAPVTVRSSISSTVNAEATSLGVSPWILYLVGGFLLLQIV